MTNALIRDVRADPLGVVKCHTFRRCHVSWNESQFPASPVIRMAFGECPWNLGETNFVEGLEMKDMKVYRILIFVHFANLLFVEILRGNEAAIDVPLPYFDSLAEQLETRAEQAVEKWQQNRGFRYGRRWHETDEIQLTWWECMRESQNCAFCRVQVQVEECDGRSMKGWQLLRRLWPPITDRRPERIGFGCFFFVWGEVDSHLWAKLRCWDPCRSQGFRWLLRSRQGQWLLKRR